MEAACERIGGGSVWKPRESAATGLGVPRVSRPDRVWNPQPPCQPLPAPAPYQRPSRVDTTIPAFHGGSGMPKRHQQSFGFRGRNPRPSVVVRCRVLQPVAAGGVSGAPAIPTEGGDFDNGMGGTRKPRQQPPAPLARPVPDRPSVSSGGPADFLRPTTKEVQGEIGIGCFGVARSPRCSSELAANSHVVFGTKGMEKIQ